MSAPTILIADDDQAICTVLEQAMQQQGYRVQMTDNGTSLLDWVQGGHGDLIITDVLMPGINGLELLPKVKALRPELPVIVISAQNTLTTAVKANQLGAFEYLPKPFDLHELLDCVKKSLSSRGVVPSAANDDDAGESLPLIGKSAAMQEVYCTLARLVSNDLTVLITGESGTGKEQVARALHALSVRKDKPFVAINMAAIPKELIESELFGHEKGAFTGAANRKGGMFEQAEGGTLFLDEIGDMPIEAQTRLLRVLQQGEYTTVGGTKTIKSNVRILCATHRDLQQLIRKGTFREDLFYRLNVVPLQVPPLRQRLEDIPALATYFLRKAAEKGLSQKELEDAAIRALQSYPWPGNVRELENMMYRLAALHSEPVIRAATVQPELAQASRQHEQEHPGNGEPALSSQVRQHLARYFSQHKGSLPPYGLYDRILPLIEKPLIELTLEATGGNQLKAANVLGLNRNTLRKKIVDLGIMPGKNGSVSPHE